MHRFGSRLAAAHAGLAEALTLQSIGFHLKPAKQTMPRAREEADRALELAENLPEAHLARALVAMFYEWDHKTAKAECDRAETLGPNVARVHMWREFYFTYVEHDYDSALAENKRAQELNPMDSAPPVREATVVICSKTLPTPRLYSGTCSVRTGSAHAARRPG